ncbi:hypothetical protein DSO57_1002393 [Entomophthora muscae]|uniref:Uncharacterized protein n=1 Tax=Entomophthora muscae TaxID=34485 RepID=A0ACC2RNP3_9FUNG|nr:hypothetical protein DSO57_1002393 [Entomophthora muscae]
MLPTSLQRCQLTTHCHSSAYCLYLKPNQPSPAKQHTCGSPQSLLAGFLLVWAVWSLLSSFKSCLTKKSSSPSTASLVASTVNITLVSPFTPPSVAICEKVLDALGELQLCLYADSKSADTPISDTQRSVAILDALDRDACLGMQTLLCQSQELGNTSSLLTLVSLAVAAPGSKASIIFEILCSKGLALDLASHIMCFAVKAASLDLPTKMAVAMFHNSLDAASADKSVWDPAPTSLKKAFALACKLRAKPAYQPKSGVLAHLLVSNPTQAKFPAAKPPKTPAINVMCCFHQTPNWPTSTGSLPVFAALAAIPEASS